MCWSQSHEIFTGGPRAWGGTQGPGKGAQEKGQADLKSPGRDSARTRKRCPRNQGPDWEEGSQTRVDGSQAQKSSRDEVYA